MAPRNITRNFLVGNYGGGTGAIDNDGTVLVLYVCVCSCALVVCASVWRGVVVWLCAVVRERVWSCIDVVSACTCSWLCDCLWLIYMVYEWAS